MSESNFHVRTWDNAELERMGADVRRVINRAVEMTALEVWGNLAREAPVDHGRLAGSFQLEQVGDNQWRIVSGVDYALAVWEGTQPHRIEPVNAQALRFEIAGEVIFAKWVDHPGTEGDDYPGRAFDAAQERVDEFIQIAIDENLRQ